MAISITGGTPNPQNITTYSAVEDATPLDPASNTGGAGQITWTTEDWNYARRLKGTDVVLSDNERGRSLGVVRAVSGDNFVAQVTADSELGKFNVIRQSLPYSGTMSGLFQYWLDLTGIFSDLDFQIQDQTVHVPGFYGTVWDHVKYLLSAHQIELALVADRVVVRYPRQAEATTNYLTQHEYQVESQTSAVAIPVNYYNNRSITQGEVYPIRDQDPSIQSVDANEIVEFDIELNASLHTVHQPIPMEAVGPGDRSGTRGAYTVVGSDNLPIMPDQWTAAGGYVRVELTRDPSVIKVLVRGADIRHLSPFRIAESAGGHDYNSLHITGDGVAWDMRTMLLNTGADPLLTSEELGTTVDNPYLSSPSQAYSASQHTAAAQSGSRITISGTAVTVNRSTFDREPVSAHLYDADRVHESLNITTMEQFNDYYEGQTLQDFDEHWREMFREDFVNQVFGNVNGARIKIEDAYYRIESATVNPDTIGYSGVMDTTIADFNAVWKGKTLEDFEEVWGDASVDHFSMAPLMNTPDAD